MTHKSRNFFKSSCFEVLIKKNLIFFSAVIFFQFLVIKALDPDWIRIRIGIGFQPQTLDPDPEPDQMNADLPQGNL
jgi:hypothetical protein